MSVELRPYEHRAVGSIVEALQHGSVLGVGPTGCGKTVIGAAVAREVSRRCVWIAHRIELLRQARDELIVAGVPREEVGLLSGSEKKNTRARFLVASIGTVATSELDFDMVVIDEAHRTAAKAYRELLTKLSHAKRLGLTASPERLDGKPLGDAYDHMVKIAGHTELVADGWLTRPICYGVAKEAAESMVRGVRTFAGDYAVGQLSAAMRDGVLMGNVVHECSRLAPNQRTIVFAVSREHGKALAQRFAAEGRAVRYLDGETTDIERARIVRGLERGAIEVVVNVDVLTEGFNCPPVKCIVLARPTKSLVRFLQQVGRASRPFNNQQALVLDHAGNIWRHGLPDMEREWSLLGRPRQLGQAPVKRCQSCEAFMPAGAATCAHCGAEQTPEPRELEEQAAQLQRIKETETALAGRLTVVREIALRRGASDEWVRRVMEAFSA